MDLKTLLKYGSRDQPSFEGATGIVSEAMEGVAGLAWLTRHLRSEDSQAGAFRETLVWL